MRLFQSENAVDEEESRFTTAEIRELTFALKMTFFVVHSICGLQFYIYPNVEI